MRLPMLEHIASNEHLIPEHKASIRHHILERIKKI